MRTKSKTIYVVQWLSRPQDSPRWIDQCGSDRGTITDARAELEKANRINPAYKHRIVKRVETVL